MTNQRILELMYFNPKYTVNENKQLLSEVTIQQKYDIESKNGKTNLSFDEYRNICLTDPTYNRQKDIVGKYTNWLLAKCKTTEDLQKVRVPLEWFADGIKRNILQNQGISNDINTYKSVDEFINAMNAVMKGNDDTSLLQGASETNQRQKLNGQFKIIGSSKYWELVTPLTFEAERWFGRETQWCTVANESYFKRYRGSEGELIIFYPKNKDLKTRIQVHFKSKSYFDVDDEGYDTIKEALLSKNNNKDIINDAIELSNNSLGTDEKRYISVEEAKQLLDSGKKPEEIFDSVGFFYNGYARVRLNGKYSFIDGKTGKLIGSGNLWFDLVYPFSEGYARVRLNGKYSLIDGKTGKLIGDGNLWFDNVGSFYEGYVAVELNNKWSFIDRNGKLIGDGNQWFDDADNFHEGYASVNLNGESYYLREGDFVLCDYNTKEPI